MVSICNGIYGSNQDYYLNEGSSNPWNLSLFSGYFDQNALNSGSATMGMSYMWNWLGNFDFTKMFENFWGNCNLGSSDTSAASSQKTKDSENADTKKLEQFEKAVKALEEKTAEEKELASFKANVNDLYAQIETAKASSDDIDKTSDDAKYDKLLERLKNLESNAEEVDDAGNIDDGGDTKPKDSKGNYIISETLQKAGYRGTYCKDIVYHSATKTHYKLNADGSIGEQIKAPSPWEIILVNADGMLKVKKIFNDTKIIATMSLDGKLQNSGKYKNNKLVSNSTYKYNDDGSYIETIIPAQKDSNGQQKTQYLKYDSNNKPLYFCDKDGKQLEYLIEYPQ